ncbi:MAG: outer membrane protein assembly factor BamD [Bacteroidetes bacterium]|nr:outer membrane protein assembly factor BamD [Bacteroidota bacterium]
MNKLRCFVFQIIFFLLLHNFNSFGKTVEKQKHSSLKLFGIPNSNQGWRKEYDKALDFYNNGLYKQAEKLFDEIIPLMVLSEEIVDARLKQAYCSYYNEDYFASIHYFAEFCNDYANSKYEEEAIYMLGLANSKVSGSIHYDQNYTQEAVYILKNYLKKYPSGKYVDEVNETLDLMLIKIHEKKYDVAYTYYSLEYFDAAKKVLGDFINDITNSKLALSARWLMLNILYYDAYYSKTEWQKWVEAMGYCLEFISDNSDLKYSKRINKIYKSIKKSIIKLESKK